MYLLDTNTVIHYLGALLPAPAMLFMQNVLDNNCNISVVTKMEALGYQFNSANEESAMETFVAGSNVLAIDDAIVGNVITLRKTLKIKLPDAIVAATALVHGLTLLTHDGGFNRLPGLTVIDPHSL